MKSPDNPRNPRLVGTLTNVYGLQSLPGARRRLELVHEDYVISLGDCYFCVARMEGYAFDHK